MQRLLTRPQFQAVLAGTVVAKTEHFALHRNALDVKKSTILSGTARSTCFLFPVQDIWLGAMVPKRWAKRAVTRNAIKRQIYIVSSLFGDKYPQAAFLVRLRREFSRKEFFSASSDHLKIAVRHELETLMRNGVTAR